MEILLSPKFDVGVNFAGMIEGLPLALVAFVIVTLIEAFLFHEFFDWKKSLWYSFVINLTSTIIGIPLLFLSGLFYYAATTSLPKIVCLSFPILIYVLTVMIEYVTFMILFKPNWKKKELLKILVRINFYSYLGLLALLIVMWLIQGEK
jgi:hypothetical protein